MNKKDRALKMLDNIKEAHDALMTLSDIRLVAIDGLMRTLENQIANAESFIAKDINTEYWEGVKNQATGTLNYLKTSGVF